MKGTVVFLTLCLLQTCIFSSGWLPNNNSPKSKNMFQMPDGIAPSLSESIKNGAEMALKMCQHLFKWERWNCPTSSFNRMQKPTKETAFSKAIVAAGVVHSITADCSRGLIPDCGCDIQLGFPSVLKLRNRSNNSMLPDDLDLGPEGIHKNWTWGGCSHDLRYAFNIASKLFNSVEKANYPADAVGRHNYNVGKKIVLDTMVKRCKCHGLSRSCSLKTCWMQVESFSKIAVKLRKKYKNAERLTYEMLEGNSVRQIFERAAIPIKRRSLVYLEQSPDYCLENLSQGFHGTIGRQCSRSDSESTTNAEKRSCKTLCKECGYRVRTETKQEKIQCNCKFVWCCEVQCEMCLVEQNDYFCDRLIKKEFL